MQERPVGVLGERLTSVESAGLPFRVVDLGRMAYRPAYEEQVRHHAEVLASREAGTPEVGRVLVVEHDPPVITVSRRQTAPTNLLATPEHLASLGVQVESTDRGGDITYHGPGQLVLYPILDLNHLGLNLSAYMRLLEEMVIEACQAFGVPAHRDACATGVWVGGADTQEQSTPESCTSAGGAKICAIGVRVRRWISMHGLALNVSTDLSHFGLIVPCGLVGRPVTSLKEQLGDRTPAMRDAAQGVLGVMGRRLSERRMQSDKNFTSNEVKYY